MRITFVLPGIGISGGVKVVLEYANRLQARGHTVSIAYSGILNPNVGSPLWRLEALLRKGKYALEKGIGKSEADWFDLMVPVIRTPSLEARYLPDADIVIATANETADWVVQLPERCGSKFYFVQGYEVWSRDPEKVVATWKMPLKKIVISSTLKRKADELGETVCAVIPNGVDTEVFYNREKTFNEPRRLLMLSHESEVKGVPDGFAAVALVRQRHPDLVLTMFGVHGPRADMPPNTEYHRQPSPDELRQLYSTADIFMSPSWSEGCQLPPMEAMACGTAVVATNVGGIPDYAVAGTTALVVEPHRPEDLAREIARLLDDSDLLARISAAGQAHIQGFSWEKATEKFEQALLGNV